MNPAGSRPAAESHGPQGPLRRCRRRGIQESLLGGRACPACAHAATPPRWPRPQLGTPCRGPDMACACRRRGLPCARGSVRRQPRRGDHRTPVARGVHAIGGSGGEQARLVGWVRAPRPGVRRGGRRYARAAGAAAAAGRDDEGASAHQQPRPTVTVAPRRCRDDGHSRSPSSWRVCGNRMANAIQYDPVRVEQSALSDHRRGARLGGARAREPAVPGRRPG